MTRNATSTSFSETDPYRELGVETGADQRTIRAAYHAHARVRHPDMGGDAAAMARINAAYELLKDRKRRAAFDAERRGGPNGAPAAGGWAHSSGQPSWTGAAGPPPGRPSGPVLDFGIFAGWSLGEIVRRDPGYLAWLSDRREGEPYVAVIERLLAPLREAAKPAPPADRAARRFWR
jgi:curved DNA-binding protein CbpA